MNSESRHTGPVILGLDERPVEEQRAAVRFATDEANRRHAALVLAHGCRPLSTSTSYEPADPPIDHERRGMELLATAATEVRRGLDPSRPIEVRLGQGTGVDLLLDLAETAGLIVLERRVIGRLKRWHTGSTTAAVAAHAGCPVVVVRADHEDSVARRGVLVGVDERGHAGLALEVGFAEAALRSASLTAAHSWLVPGPQPGMGYVAPDLEELQAYEEQAEIELAEALAGFGERYPDVVVRRTVSSGPAAQLLDGLAERAELMIVGRHSSSRVPTFALGAVARHALDHAPCPVMIVPPTRSPRERPPRWLVGELPIGAGY
jgi:nucleotide-binding universal stress UspA family protein